MFALAATMQQATSNPVASAAATAALISCAERPNLFSRRDGSILRLVPVNQRLSPAQLEHFLQQLLAQQHMQQILSEHVSKHILLSKRPPRHVAAWLRGCCYLAAGNFRQALQDARTALAYAPATAALAAQPAAAAAATETAKPPPAAAPLEKAASAVTPGANTRVVPAGVPLNAAAASAGPAEAADPLRRKGSSGWMPALLLAGEAYAGLGQHAQAVVHLAQAQRIAPPYTAPAVASAMRLSVSRLSPDQGYAWATGGLEGLLQQLQDEEELRLPEVMRPRPKWYYYTQWMKQRIHLALLELHLAATLTTQQQPHLLDSSSSSSSSRSDSGGDSGTTSGVRGVRAETSISSARGRLLLSLLAEGVDEAPVVAAAAAAAGFACQTGKSYQPLSLPAASASDSSTGSLAVVAPAASAEEEINSSSSSSGGGSGGRYGSSGSSGGVLQLPAAVLDKLLSMDAGDLDLMVQHPVALQGQVYELLDVLQAHGPESLANYPLQPLSWEEVQALAGPGTVGLPLGYTPSAQLLPPPQQPALLPPQPPLLPLAAQQPEALPVPASNVLSGTVPQPAAEVALTEVTTAEGSLTDSNARSSWRRPGWMRAQYVQEAVAAAAAIAEKP